jgi:hypothetical protein
MNKPDHIADTGNMVRQDTPTATASSDSSRSHGSAFGYEKLSDNDYRQTGFATVSMLVCDNPQPFVHRFGGKIECDEELEVIKRTAISQAIFANPQVVRATITFTMQNRKMRDRDE